MLLMFRPNVKGHGTVDVSGRGISLKMTVDMTMNKSSGGIHLNCSYCSVGIDHLSVTFHGGARYIRLSLSFFPLNVTFTPQISPFYFTACLSHSYNLSQLVLKYSKLCGWELFQDLHRKEGKQLLYYINLIDPSHNRVFHQICSMVVDTINTDGNNALAKLINGLLSILYREPTYKPIIPYMLVW